MTTMLDLDEIKSLVDTPQLIQEIETGFVLYSEGKVVVPPVGFLHFDNPPGDVHIKYGFISGGDYYVLKMASGFYDNAKVDLPVADGVILVFSQKTGALELILLDRCWLTDMRTAAAGAVAAKHLAPGALARAAALARRPSITSESSEPACRRGCNSRCFARSSTARAASSGVGIRPKCRS